MKNLILFLLMNVFQAYAPAQETQWTISGMVTDATTGQPLSGVVVTSDIPSDSTVTDALGKYTFRTEKNRSTLTFRLPGFMSRTVNIRNRTTINVALQPASPVLMEAADPAYFKSTSNRSRQTMGATRQSFLQIAPAASYGSDWMGEEFNTEGYRTIHENEFSAVKNHPLSTFSIDVDAASYSNVRRFINQGRKPPKDAVRIEEMINYFDYAYPQPSGHRPFSINTELSSCPWNENHLLLHIGLQGREISVDNLPPSNLVFLIDVSGSMQPANKLPLLKSAFKMLVQKLRPSDYVSIVVYAGAAGLVLPPTSGNEKETIVQALDRLTAGGSTAGGAGLRLAYETAATHFKKGGNNRIILATDGDFNVGPSSNAEMERLIVTEREKGIFITVLGFGMGNYKDDKMETIADKGNGNYAYIDNLQEARKVLINEFGGTLFTIAKDVKIQVEFNPANVQAYRLIGYENRKLKSEDFNNDQKDAGELGAGHTVTALYEIIPAGVKSEFVQPVDELKYQVNVPVRRSDNSDELLTLKLRYKEPEGSKSKLITSVVRNKAIAPEKTSENFRWSAAVAEFGMLLRESPFKGTTNTQSILNLAKGARGTDPFGYRSEFIRLVESSEYLASR